MERPPFDTDGNCTSATATAAAGDDCGMNSNQVRTKEVVIYNWSIVANNYGGAANPKNVVLEQILHPSANADITFNKIPARCTPAGGGGSTPVSAITTEANGDVKLVCNLGELTEGSGVFFRRQLKYWERHGMGQAIPVINTFTLLPTAQQSMQTLPHSLPLLL